MANKTAEAADLLLPLLRPPRIASRTLDRPAFAASAIVPGALVRNPRLIESLRRRFTASRDLLDVPRISALRTELSGQFQGLNQAADKNQSSKLWWLLLDPNRVRPAAPENWSETLRGAVDAGEVEEIREQEVKVGYDHWSYLDVMRALLPDEMHDEIPTSYNHAGHVAHLNLREYHLRHKHLIGQVLIDKNPSIRTVINKVRDVGTESKFRTFPYEVLAGPDDLDVSVSENGCTFKFNYGQVYWNSKLDNEHTRLVRDYFRPGEVVCDVMAGVGPFAVPAGKKNVFVMANDLNPCSFEALKGAIESNRVGQFIKAFNCDGGRFIQQSGELVLAAYQRGDKAILQPKIKSSRRSKKETSTAEPPEPTIIPLPQTIAHYVMNLPGSAITFLHHFRGVYHGHESLFAPHSEVPLPLVHVYCFCNEKDAGDVTTAIVQRIREQFSGHGEEAAKSGILLELGEDGTVEGRIHIEDVRDVAPNKRMFCATFRLPRDVAFAERIEMTEV